ncbi:hypothetical protein BDV12DRAFT_208461 [Aspergillus spectabilis]
MFAPLGLFREIPCPQGEQCSLMACIFSHQEVVSSQVLVAHSQPEEKEADEPAAKRIKLDPLPAKKDILSQASSGIATKATPTRKPVVPVPKAESSQPLSQQPGISKVTPVKCESTTASSGSNLPPRQAPKESLNPRMIPKSPATFNVRLAILKKLHSTLCSLNDMLAKDKELKDKCLVLTPDELITMALDEEEKAAKDNPTIYSNIVKLRIVKLSKLSKENWAEELKEYLNKKYYKPKSADAPKDQKEPKVFTTGLTVEEEFAVAPKLVTPLQGLEEYGYVTRAPTEQEIETARKGVLESKGWEKCDRCGGRFQVFPGRREDGTLTTGGPCTHHPGKALYPPKKKIDHVTGSREAYFTCCNETLGQSPGCTKGESHVFKVSETKRLASILQFETTPENPNLKTNQPICFDCEMGYTTLGLELIRLTAVSWPQGKKILDILVRPLGEILDLNSRFSGVYPEQYTNALPYTTQTPPSETETDTEPQPLQVVDSPSTARTLFFTHLTPSTPLIGHAIDNDLNACRIIHPTVIDTAILYPHPGGGLPYRMSLRALAKRHLERDIQVGGRGHDSMEDAVATGDLVRVKAAEVLRGLKREGWVVQKGVLVKDEKVELQGFV